MSQQQLFREVTPASEWCQRWQAHTHTFRHITDPFNPDLFAVEPVAEVTAKHYIETNHYAGSYSAAKWRLGLWDGTGLVGVAVFGIPMSKAVLTNTFPSLEAMVESIELSRLVLADRVPGNGESWFLARCFEHLAARGVRGVVTFADPVPRRVGDRVVFPGHLGIIYMASNAVYSGRSTPRTLTLLPDGTVLSDRSAQKVRARERGHEHVERKLISLGATPPGLRRDGAVWLREALEEIGARRFRHQGNHRYAFPLGVTRRERRNVTIAGDRRPYPKTGAAA